jgi:hypothetical protein
LEQLVFLLETDEKQLKRNNRQINEKFLGIVGTAKLTEVQYEELRKIIEYRSNGRIVGNDWP